MTKSIFTKSGDYQKLRSYQKTVIVYDATVHFCERFHRRNYRQTDQMVHAARSGKQNIIEGARAGRTSAESEIKLTNVARASLEELLEDYRDFLRIRNLVLWTKESEDAAFIRKHAYREDESFQTYQSFLKDYTPEIAANTVICLIHQANFLLDRQIRSLEQTFIKEGGLREKMYDVRRETKKRY